MVCGIRGADVCTARLSFFCVSFVWFVYFVVQQNLSGLAVTMQSNRF